MMIPRALIFVFSVSLSLGVTTTRATSPVSKSISQAAPQSTPAALLVPRLTGAIQIHGRQLWVDGKPFEMKAICYSPVPKGKKAPGEAIFVNPTQEELTVVEQDFKLMHAAGFNTIRTYVPITDHRVLDLLLKYHLKTIVPVFNNAAKTPFAQIKKTVALLKNHPSTFIWEIGNEWNYNNFYLIEAASAHYTGTKDPIELLKQAIATVRSEDTTHPISTVIGEMPKEEHFWKSLPDEQIDLYGSNIYDGRDFGNHFERWEKISSKPLYIGEYGATAFNANIDGPDQVSQATAIKSLLHEINNNLSSKNPKNVLVGAALFEWNDEWWKSGGSPNEHGAEGFYLIPDKKGGLALRAYPHDEATDASITKVSGPYPDHIFHEKWWGIVDIDRNTRPAYDVIKEFYAQ